MADKNITWDDIPSLEIDDGDLSGNYNKRLHERIAENGLKKLLPATPSIIVRMFSPKVGFGLMEGQLLDLSKKGVKIKTEKAIPINDVIELLILLGNRKIKCKGIVKWVKQELNNFHIGLEFMDISPMDSKYISNMIASYYWRYLS